MVLIETTCITQQDSNTIIILLTVHVPSNHE